ncbi:MAG TPA: hypothetical protein VM580_15835 [Labilithrix sp.]|nr:hypothetical protein [Labilithrix sp.]
MHKANRLFAIERLLGDIAFVVGRVVTRGVEQLPRMVRSASGLHEPSPEAIVAGLVSGITTLAPKAMGPIAGPCVRLAGNVSVLALATWAVRETAHVETRSAALGKAIADAEQRGACTGLTATLWRSSAGLAPLDHDVLLREALDASVAGVGRRVFGLALAQMTKRVRGLEVGLALADAWQAMGEAARLVDAARASVVGEACLQAGVDPPSVAA